MKSKFVFAALVLSAGVAFAKDVTTSYTMGAMPLAVEAGDTIINVPWIEAGSESEGIAVSNIVKTATLTVGDYLLWYTGSSSNYNGWVLAESGGIKYWEAINTVSRRNGVTVVPSAVPALNRGDALILHSQNATNIYIVGQYSNSSTKTTISQGYNLLAPPIYSDGVDLNDYTWASAGAGDRIIMPDGTGFVYDATRGWGKNSLIKGKDSWTWEFTEAAYGAMTITAGSGFWYEKKSGEPFDLEW